MEKNTTVENNSVEEMKLADAKIDLTFYKVNSASYYGVLLGVLLEIYFLISVLSNMTPSYLIGIFIIVNIVFLLMLFTCALQIKVYSKFWSIVAIVFGGYNIARIFIVPFILNVKTNGVTFVIIDILIAALMILSGIYSLGLIIKKDKFIKDEKISFIQRSK